MANVVSRGPRQILLALRYSLKGLSAAYRYEASFRLEAQLFVVLAPLGLWFGHGPLEKAWLVASLLLDIELRALSNGDYSMKRLVKELAVRYGRYKSFKDADLFAVITEMTYPEVGKFLKDYVGGIKPLPINEIFNKIGMEYDAGDHKVYPKPDATEEELALRSKWLFGE